MTAPCFAERYLQGDVIGTGGMAVVYKGHDIRTGRTVAIKVLRAEYNNDAEFVTRFEREALAASAISHENLIDLYNVGVQDGQHFIVMEYVDGLTLKQLIEQQGALDNYTAVSIARQMCQALKLVHEAHIIHRDIKSQNILLDRRGIAKLADFGIARLADSNTATLNGDKGVLGSVHYFSPEQALGERATMASDIYSLGVVLFEMLAGRLPFDAETPMGIAMQHINAPVPSLRQINPLATQALEEIIGTAMSKAPNDRYQTAQEFYDDLCLALVYPEGGFTKKKARSFRLSGGVTAAGWTGRATQSGQAAAPGQNTASGRNTSSGRNTGFNVKPRHSRPHDGKRRLWPILITVSVVLVLCVAALLALLFQQGLLRHWTKTPLLVGMQYEAAKQKLDGIGVGLTVQSYLYDDAIAAGTVLEQSPVTGAPVRMERGKVRVVVCRGSANPIVPNLIGFEQEEAQKSLEAIGLRLGTVNRVEDSQAERGTVVRQSPEAEESLVNGDVVNLWVSYPPLLRTIPDLSGHTLAEAEAAIVEAGLRLGEVHHGYTADAKTDTVYKQTPAAAASLRDGESVDIWICAPLAFYRYTKDIAITDDATEVKIYIEDQNENKLIYNEVRDKGAVSIDMNLESDAAGEKTILVYLNDVEFSRETVWFTEAEE